MKSEKKIIYLVRGGESRRNDIPSPAAASETLLAEGVETMARTCRALSSLDQTIDAVYISEVSRAASESAGMIIKYVCPNLEVKQIKTPTDAESNIRSDENPFINNILTHSESAINEFIFEFAKELGDGGIDAAVLVGDEKLIRNILINSGFIYQADGFQINHGAIFKCNIVPPLVLVTKILN